jgi:hypothetical protein
LFATRDIASTTETAATDRGGCEINSSCIEWKLIGIFLAFKIWSKMCCCILISRNHFLSRQCKWINVASASYESLQAKFELLLFLLN